MSWPWIVAIIAAAWLAGAVVIGVLFRRDARSIGEPMTWKEYVAVLVAWPAVPITAAWDWIGARRG